MGTLHLRPWQGRGLGWCGSVSCLGTRSHRPQPESELWAQCGRGGGSGVVPSGPLSSVLLEEAPLGSFRPPGSPLPAWEGSPAVPCPSLSASIAALCLSCFRSLPQCHGDSTCAAKASPWSLWPLCVTSFPLSVTPTPVGQLLDPLCLASGLVLAEAC